LARDRTDHRQIANELGVRAILSGEVSQRGERLSVRVALVDAQSDRQLWGERYDRTEDDILAIEKDIANRICEALRVRLTGEQQTELVTSYTDNTQAYRAYKEARFWWNKRTQDGFTKASALYDEAIDIDPSYALAYAGKADCYLMAGLYFQPARETMPLAKEAIDAAFSIDPSLAEAHTARGYIRFIYDWDWACAERDFRKAIKLNPEYATAHHWYAVFLASQGRLDESLREIRRARELDPGSLIINTTHGLPYLFSRHYDRAIEQYRNTLAMDPTFIPARVELAWALMANHQYDEAIAEIQRVYEKAGRFPQAAGLLGAIHAAAGDREQARQELQTLTAMSEQQNVPALAFALIHAELGEYDAAFARIDQAFEARDGWLAFLAVSPDFDALRQDPRFDELLRRIGLGPLAGNRLSTAGERPE
jgi:Tfp pilus assembly protein PilF